MRGVRLRGGGGPMAASVPERVRVGGDHVTAAPRAHEPPVRERAVRPLAAAGRLRPSQVPALRGTASLTGSTSPRPGEVRQLRPGGASAGSARRSAQPSAVPARSVQDVLRGSGQPLPTPLRHEMESRLSADLSDVRLHVGSAARASATEVGARAYTSGSHVVIGDGGADKHTLAHELTHVIQQRQGPVAGTDHGDGLKVSDPLDVHEQAAEANATLVMRAPLGEHPLAAAPPGLVRRRRQESGQMRQVNRGGGASDSHPVPVQRTVEHGPGTEIYRPANPEIISKLYRSQYEVIDNKQDVRLTLCIKDDQKVSAALFEQLTLPTAKMHRAQISVKSIPANLAEPERKMQFSDRIASLAHEFQHAIDVYCHGIDAITLAGMDPKKLEVGDPARAKRTMQTEWNAWAVEAAVVYEQHKLGSPAKPEALKLVKEFMGGRDKLVELGSIFFERCMNYLFRDVFPLLSDKDDETKEKKFRSFISPDSESISEGKSVSGGPDKPSQWLADAIDLFNRHKASVDG